MINKMDKYTIINLRKKGMSFRKIALELGIDRKTVSRICHTYFNAQEIITTKTSLVGVNDEITEMIIGDIKYDTSRRGNRKLTPEIKQRICEIMDFEKDKTKLLGIRHKQKLTGTQIYEIIKEENYDVGETTVRNYIRELRQSRETFIKQEYDLGSRLEYDFGEVKLYINNKTITFYLAVLSCPASGFRYAYLYKRQNMEVFLDSHVRFFEMIGGSYKEVVYDNMRNVVKQFLPNGEKLITQGCLNLALYYDYEINTTNIRKGNEKGHVESSVKVVRNRVFTKKYKFNSYEEACQHLKEELVKINKDSKIDEEKRFLSPYRPPFELAEVLTANVDNYGCITVENNFYSVPDYLMSHKVTIKKYVDRILIYSNNEFICEHKKIDGSKNYQLVLSHYLKTFNTKPKALKHSLVLKQNPQLQNIYQQHFKTRTKEFIALLQNNSDKSMSEVIEVLKYQGANPLEVTTNRCDVIEDKSREQLKMINQLMS